MPVPPQPKIFHITHLDNLPGITEEGVIWSDRKRIELAVNCAVVGMSKIKRRRLDELTVKCNSPTKVGEYVPFYFCPRSIMLYILWRGNHPEVTYRGGQVPVVHLVADVRRVVAWATAEGRRWAFSDRNAGTHYADFFKDLGRLDEVDWSAVDNLNFRDATVAEGKQAEFLMHESFPWTLVERIGVHDDEVRGRVQAIVDRGEHRPQVDVMPDWYY